MDSIESIRVLQARLHIRRRVILVLSLCGVIGLTILSVGAFARISLAAGIAISLVWFIFVCWLLYRAGVLHKATITDASLLLDREYQAQERASTLVELSLTNSPDSEAHQHYIKAQLDSIVQKIHPSKISLPKTPQSVRAYLYAIAPIWIAIVLLWFFWNDFLRFSPPRPPKINRIKALLEEKLILPSPLHEELQQLAAAMDKYDVTNEKVQEALDRTQSELEAAKETLSDSGSKPIQAQTPPATKSPDSAQPAAAASPTPTPSQSEQKDSDERPQEKNQKDTQDSSKQEAKPTEPSESKESSAKKDADVQNSKPQQGDSKDAEQQNQSESDGDGQGGQSGQGKEQSGQGQSGEKQDSQQEGGKQGAEGSSKGKAGGEQGQEQKQESKGDQKQASKEGQSGDSEGKQQDQSQESDSQKQGKSEQAQTGQSGKQQQALSKVEQALNEIRNEQQQGKDPQGQSGQSNDSKTPQKEPKENKNAPSGGSKKDTPSKQEDSTQKQPGNNSAHEPKQESPEEGSTDAGTRDSKQDEQKSQSPKTEQDRTSNKDFEEKGSSKPDHNAELKPLPEGQGPGGEGLGGKKGYQDVEVKGQDEKYDTRFTDQKGTTAKNDKPAEFKTDLSDVRLSKPDSIRDEAKQPIPLEYDDILR